MRLRIVPWGIKLLTFLIEWLWFGSWMYLHLPISAGDDGGPRFRVCKRLTLRSAPHRHRQKFSAHVSGRGVKEILIFWFQPILSTFRFLQKKLKNRGRGPPNLFSPQFLFCCALKPHAKFQNPMITKWKVSWAERERAREGAVNSGHLIQWQHTQTAWTKI